VDLHKYIEKKGLKVVFDNIIVIVRFISPYIFFLFINKQWWLVRFTLGGAQIIFMIPNLTPFNQAVQSYNQPSILLIV
jgi:hypothetical protein